jgi:hypothetical protein
MWWHPFEDYALGDWHRYTPESKKNAAALGKESDFGPGDWELMPQHGI